MGQFFLQAGLALVNRPVLVVTLAAGLAAGAILTRWFYVTTDAASEQAVALPMVPDASGFDADAPLVERIAALEIAVSIEREARQLLEEQLFDLLSEMEGRDGADVSVLAPNAAVEPTGTAGADADVQRSYAERRRQEAQARRDRLIDLGFSPVEADRILTREAELQMDALRARYDAERAGEELDFFTSRNSASQALREELGDEAYARYREANGRSVSVTVASVIESSPAQTAGLRAGDRIVSYDGQRVFGMTDLTEATKQGTPGETVVVDIVRDGVPMQVVMPRGPLGISGGRRFRN